MEAQNIHGRRHKKIHHRNQSVMFMTHQSNTSCMIRNVCVMYVFLNEMSIVYGKRSSYFLVVFSVD